MANLSNITLPDPEERKSTIHLVEDEVVIRMAVSDYLQECGFKVLEASTAGEAITMLQSYGTAVDAESSIDVVFSDVRMPGKMDGFGLAQWVREHRPGLPVLLTSGDATLGNTAKGLCEKLNVLPKPYDFQSMVTRLRSLIRTLQNKDD